MIEVPPSKEDQIFSHECHLLYDRSLETWQEPLPLHPEFK